MMVELLFVSITTGVLTGVVTGWLVAKAAVRHHCPNKSFEAADDEPTFVTDEAADAWAASTGRPGFGPFAASKLRTVEQITRRRERRNKTRRTP